MRTLALIIIVFLHSSTPVLAVDTENCLDVATENAA